MIKPLLFPFTHLTGRDKELLSFVFQSFSILSMLSKKEIVSGFPGLVESSDFIPIPEKNLTPVTRAVNNYSQWARIHGGDSVALKAFMGEAQFFTSDNDVSSIYSKIRKDTSTEKKFEENIKPQTTRKEQIFQALFFLKLAEQWDAENEVINGNLIEVAKKESLLFSSMKGEVEKYEENTSGVNFSAINEEQTRSFSQDQAIFMTEQRLQSWSARLEVHTSGLDEEFPWLFVTTSPSSLALVESMAENSKLLLDINRLKVHEDYCKKRLSWQNDFLVSLDRFLKNEIATISLSSGMEDDCSVHIGIKLYLFSGDRVKNLFCFSENHEKLGKGYRMNNGRGKGIPVFFIEKK